MAKRENSFNESTNRSKKLLAELEVSAKSNSSTDAQRSHETGLLKIQFSSGRLLSIAGGCACAIGILATNPIVLAAGGIAMIGGLKFVSDAQREMRLQCKGAFTLATVSAIDRQQKPTVEETPQRVTDAANTSRPLPPATHRL